MKTCEEYLPEAKELVECLKKKGYHVTTAESCTGGMIASSIVDVSGASEVFEEGYVTYSNRIKIKNLGVSKETIENYTVVSAPVAQEMASGVVKKAGTEAGISVTGYAGPDAAEDGTPAGTVYIGTCYHGVSESRKYHFDGSRKQVREQATKEAIRFMLERIKSWKE